METTTPKFDVNRPDLYRSSQPELKERTQSRLTAMAEAGMEELGTAEFGYRGVVSGLYIERVWNYSDEEFNSYLDWAKSKKVTN